MVQSIARGRLLWFLPLVAAPGCARESSPTTPATVASYTSPMWYEETRRYFQVSPDGRRAIYGTGSLSRLLEIPSGKVDSTWNDGLAQLRGGAFDSQGTIVRLGSSAGAMGWFRGAGAPAEAIDIPPDVFPRWSPNGANIAWFPFRDSSLTLGQIGKTADVNLGGVVSGANWTPDGKAVFATVLHADGLTSLLRIDLDGTVTSVREHLDASPSFNTIAFSPNGKTSYLALASDTIPVVAVRHDPEAPHRDLDLYALTLSDGRLSLMFHAADDDCCPIVAGGFLYWTHNDPGADVVVFPRGGGEPRAVADHGFLPRWSRDGKQIAFTRGYFRLSDYGLDMDGWRVGIDSSGRASSPPAPWITGFGEDMGPVWSPDGKWVAYHSHRSPTAVPLYESSGRTDDQFLQLAAGGPEIRLTDFGFEVGPPDWSADGRHLIFDMWETVGPPRVPKPWVVTLDPQSGRPLGAKRVPLPNGVNAIATEAWSPKGDDIAFVERVGEAQQALWTMRPDASAARRLVQFAGYTIGGVAWSPDAKELLYGAVTDGRMHIFAISSTGGASHQLTNGDVNYMHPAVSPDGRWIAASRIRWKKELRRIRIP